MPSFRQRTRILALLSLCALLVTVGHSLLVSVPSETALADYPECSDGFDNDMDGDVDYPDDADCRTPQDESEGERGRFLYVSVSDGADEVVAGGSLHYTVALRNDSDEMQLVNVKFYIPQYANLLSASEGGRTEGAYVSWKDVAVFPDYVKNLYVSIEVSPYAKDGALLVAEVISDDAKASDTTIIVEKEEMAPPPLFISVNDGRVFTEPNEELRYQITVDNTNGPDRDFALRTYLPPFLTLLSASGLYKQEQREVVWNDEFIAAGERVVYELNAVVERDAPEFTILRLRVSSAAALGTDTTTVLYEKIPPTAAELSVNDGHETAVNGEELTYAILLHNNEEKLLTGITMKDAIPTYTEFVSATEGGRWTGNDVLWEGLTVSPFGKRLLNVTVRVRSDAPLGALLKNSVQAAGRVAVDVTEVSTTSQGNDTVQPKNTTALLRKVADRNEVRPGDVVQYTIYLRNTLDHVITDISVDDRMDPTFATVLNAQQGELAGDTITWYVGTLNPGEEWSVQYNVRIDPNTPHGTQIANVVSVSGTGIESLSLTELVRTSSIGVMTKMPPSGAPLDVLCAGVIALLSALMTGIVRRKQSLLW
ncbi:MAG: hypothetical protein WCX61_01070 [Candidatus Peribacteraceae bacterium]